LPIATSIPGFLLLDPSLKPIASNSEAIKILAFPTKPDNIGRIEVFLADKIRSSLVDRQSSKALEFVREYKSGRRRYMCRAFCLDCDKKGAFQPAFALILERYASGATVFSEMSRQFDLTEREMETVQLLVQGLTSKEIAGRMNISPNTVKAFLRLVMVKMGVSTRSGIAGKVFTLNSSR
jgi:DNA-binding CsgD family transcriptional regulator